MTTVCETLGVARSNIAESVKRRPSQARGRPPLADRELVDEIKTIIDDMPTYGYRRVHAILCRKARSESRPWPNAKRVYRVMKVQEKLLLCLVVLKISVLLDRKQERSFIFIYLIFARGMVRVGCSILPKSVLKR